MKRSTNKIWFGDITYIPTREGYLFLATFLDLYSSKEVGWSMANNMKEQLVLDAFIDAKGRNKCDQGLIVHTDQGSQYTSYSFQKLLAQNGAISSMSRKGNPYDNAVMESFYKILKAELKDNFSFDTRKEAEAVVLEYIEMFYNRKRLHSSIDFHTPT